MKKIFCFFLFVSLAGCENPGDCIKSTGPLADRAYDGLVFDKVIVNKGIAVVITEGPEYKVEVSAGENLINDIEVTTADGFLTLADNTSCNWTREYGESTVYITCPNLTDIYSKTEKIISSNGILHFPQLRLVSMNGYDGFGGVGTGDFKIGIDAEKLTVDSNEIAGFYLNGTVAELHLNFYESGGVFHGENLVANDIAVFHRGTNDLFVRPIGSISGDIYNIGNIICYTHPAVVAVTQHYNGRLIFY